LLPLSEHKNSQSVVSRLHNSTLLLQHDDDSVKSSVVPCIYEFRAANYFDKRNNRECVIDYPEFNYGAGQSRDLRKPHEINLLRLSSGNTTPELHKDI
jgi:hypothetical protein